MIVQIAFKVPSLSEYYREILKGKIVFYDGLCPICGSSDCYKPNGFYTRVIVFDSKGRAYRDLPIFRFYCGETKRTFSLLPHELIPYCRYSINFIFEVIALILMGLSYNEALDKVDAEEASGIDFLRLSVNSLKRLINYILQAGERLRVNGFSVAVNVENKWVCLNNIVDFMNGFECGRYEEVIRGPCGLVLELYCKTKRFLFGKPSQER